MARYDGEKFIIILIKTNAEDALMVAENILASIEELAVVHESMKVLPSLIA